jgi:hypothetical protein
MKDLIAGSAPAAAVPPVLTRPTEPQHPPAVSAAPAAVPAVPYSGPAAGKLACDGQPIPQNGEYIFTDLPPVKLHLVYDTNTWEGVLVPSGQTQRLILRNEKPGSQKKCTVEWTVVP